MTNKSFGGLVRGMINASAAFAGKRAELIEEEVGDLACLAPSTIQGYKRGRVPENRQTIEVLAEFGVKRAYLSREWLRRLLESLRYYDAQSLIDQLTPTADVAPQLPGARDNLPAPTYSRFILRPAAYAQLIEGLGQRSALIVLVSMGGMGKSSLALEVAKRCIGQGDWSAQQPTPPAFDAAVWISAHDQQATLAQLLDTAALTLGHPGLTRLDLRERQHAVGQLLRQQRTLIVVDGFEASNDPALLDWLLRLPEPSKALVTTRVYRREFQRGAWLVELDGMTEAEAQELIGQTLRRLHLGPSSPEAAQRLWGLSGGNPKAIEMALGHARHTGQPLTHVLDTLFVAQGELFDELFTRNWELLGPGARSILVAATLFVGSATPEALLCVAGGEGTAFTPMLQKLVDLSLVELAQASDTAGGARYGLHPLTRSFIDAKLPEQDALAAAARERWLSWCVGYASSTGGFVLDDLDRLARLDLEEPTLFAATGWAIAHDRHTEAVALIQALEFYYYVRALWGKKLTLHRWYIDAARALGDNDMEIAGLALQIQLLSQQGRLEEVAPYLLRLHALAEHRPLAGATRFSYQHTLGVYLLTTGDPAAARPCWELLLADAALVSHMQIGSHHWLGRCLLAEGRPVEARRHFEAALTIARAQGFGRMIGRNQVALALLEIAAGELDLAAQRLEESRQLTVQNDWEQRARLLWAQARLAAGRGLREEATDHYTQAHALLERMGLARESAELGGELRTLGGGI